MITVKKMKDKNKTSECAFTRWIAKICSLTSLAVFLCSVFFYIGKEFFGCYYDYIILANELFTVGKACIGVGILGTVVMAVTEWSMEGLG